MSNNKDILVSVVMITYGHEAFISKAIHGVLNQNTDFEYELIISNDNSPDDTDTIIKDIINGHPKGYKIKYFNHSVNKGMTQNFIWALEQAKGDFIALCEGDDFWLNTTKLSQQVEFLENNFRFSLVCSNYSVEDGGKGFLNFESHAFSLIENFDIWRTKTLTLCFRHSEGLISFLKKFQYTRDVHLNYYLLRQGDGWYMNEIFGTYNIHEGGVYSMKSKQEQLEMAKVVSEELYDITKEVIFKKRLNILEMKMFFLCKKYFRSLLSIRYYKTLRVYVKLLLR